VFNATPWPFSPGIALHPLCRKLRGPQGLSGGVQQIRQHRDSNPGQYRFWSIPTELPRSAFLREANPNFAKGSCIGAVSIHMEGLREDKIYFGMIDPLPKPNSVQSWHESVQFPHYPSVTNGAIIMFVATVLPCRSHQTLCLSIRFAPACQTRITSLAFQSVLQSKHNAGCISLHKHFYNRFWNNIAITILPETWNSKYPAFQDFS
jgi:hypothetical protein